MASQNGGKQRGRGRSKSVDRREKREATPEKKAKQLAWRKGCLLERTLTNRLSEKNNKELASLTV